ncbi:uncharacterized protein N7529_000862 [Penicillium soppii]|uniref:uncharacterized protein n=1 Tax=Penicillium soppii TaxID=69789 RepID=UPI002547EAC2|nr:uncharacterized protein N7529_000862 [Penicillium soppii]KAJ5882190.1 hypothetical protein N7529_000862 [Penicillium soppii]
MNEPPSTRGSPSKQLAAFTPTGLDAMNRRGNSVSFSGTASLRPTNDPFAGWPGSVGGVPSTGVSDYFASQATPAGITPGLIQAASNILASPDRVSGAQHQGSLDHHGYPTISPRLTPSNAPGRLQYPLSGSQTGPSLDQYQYSPTRAQAALSQSQYPLSPDLIGSGSGNLSIDSHARYSPSREGGTIPYSPEQSFLNQMVAELEGRQAANTPSHGYSIGPDVHTSSVQAPSSGLAQAPEASQLPLPGTPNRASLGMQPRRSLIVEGVPRETEHASIVHLFPIAEFTSLEGIFLKHVHENGRFSVTFADIRDCMDAIKKVHKDCSMWHVRYATIHEIAAAGLLSPFATTLNREDGHIVVSVYIDPRQQDRQFFENTDQFVDHVISTFGHRRSCYRISVDGASVLEYRVEYFNIHNAAHALSSLDNLLLDFMRFDVTVRNQDDAGSRYRTRTPNMSSPVSPVTPYQASPTSPSLGELPSPIIDDQTSAEHTIDIGKIQCGEDLRTTDQLKDILDESSFGKYDFIYLRMDFVHRCNVGYAFVNFHDPISIVDLVMARQGLTWPNCISEKRAEISYATQQGRDVLINKFRNSNVMTRPHDERPHLYHTEGPRIGLEAPFPGPNDASKLRRSVASTNQQGLFAPRTRSGNSPQAVRNRSRTISTSNIGQSGRASTRTPRHSNARSLNSPPGDPSSPMQLEVARRFSQSERNRNERN